MPFARFLRVLGLPAVLALALLAGPALAQVAEPADPPKGIDLEAVGTLLGAILVALLGLWAVGRDLINRMAARPAVDGWDRAKAVVDKLEPWAETLAKIADPKDETAAPTPSNPTGKAVGAP